MTEVYSTILSWIPRNSTSIIDIGCGRGHLGYALRADCLETSRKIKRLVGLDNNFAYLDFLTHHQVYDELIQHDLKKGYIFSNDKEFDVAVLCDILEHLTGPVARQILKDAERIAKLVVISVITVKENLAVHGQHHGSKLVDDNIHRTWFTVGEMKDRGYIVRGLDRSKVGHYSRVSTMIENPFWYLPQMSGRLLCRNRK